MKKASSLLVALLLLAAVPVLAVPTGPIVGQTTVVLGDVTAVDQDGDVFDIRSGGDIYAGITLATSARAFVKATMLDGTTLSLGENGNATIESFTFDRDAQLGSFAATVDKGASVYASGEIGTFSATRQHSTITTPHAVVGIRGSVVQILVTEFTVVRNEEGNITLTSRTTGNVIVLDVGEAAQVTEESDGKIDISGLPSDVADELDRVIQQDESTSDESVDVTTISSEGDSTIISSPINPE